MEQDGLGKIWCDEAAIVTIRFDLVTERSAAQADTKAAIEARGTRRPNDSHRCGTDQKSLRQPVLSLFFPST